jgi:chorismate mutase-like protein
MNLDKLRQQIDQLDQKILRLLNERLSLAPVIGQKKKQIGGAVFAPDREEALLARLMQSNRGPTQENDLRAIYREIFSSSRARQGGIDIGIPQDDLASYGVARSIFGNQERYQGIEDLTVGLTALQKKKIDLLCVPMSVWLAAESFSKNMGALAKGAQVFLQIQPPVLSAGQSRSPLPPYWVLVRKGAVGTAKEVRSGWFFFEGKPKPQSRAVLQKFLRDQGWEPWIDRVIEYSNRQSWRCGVEWRKVLTLSEYKKWQRELRKLRDFQLDVTVGSERNIG